jgi:transposase
MEGISFKDIHRNLTDMGVKISYSNLCRYCGKHFESSHTTTVLKNPPVRHSVSRKQIREHLWSGKELDPKDRQWLFEYYPDLNALLEYVCSFREAIHTDSSLNQWIENAKTASLPTIRSFANGLERDFEAVLNAARFDESNAFLEGNINRLKMIKRSMFGRAGLPLLSAKVVGLCAYS